MPVIAELKEVTKVYGTDTPVPVTALREVTLSIEAGEFTAIAGPSGSGKTTLLNMLGALDRPTSGEVVVVGHRLNELNRNQRADFRLWHVGFVFQTYNLIPVLTAEENAEFVLLLRGVGEKERRESVRAILQEMGIGPELWGRKPSELSGGQQQRVAVARALVARPDLILADEPTANLDSQTAARLLDIMREMNERHGATFVFSTHDPMVMERARRLVHLRDGRIVSDETRA